MSAVYWLGTDGNIWVRNGDSVQNMGTPTGAGGATLVPLKNGLNPNGYDATGGSGEARLISDPLPGGVKEVSTPTVTGSGGTTYQDTSAARAGTQTSIDSIDGILNNKLTEAQGEYDEIIKSYGADEVANKTAFDTKVSQNEGNRESQQQAALLAAANGGRGLYSALASIGALGGTGKLLANRAVSNEANVDIGNANKTFDTNAGSLYDSYGELQKQEKQRRLDAENTLKKSQQQLRYDAAVQRQNLYKDMADLWGKAGNFGESNRYTGEAAKLTADLMNNTRPNVGTYATTPLQYSAPALQSYLAGANDMTVNASAGAGQLPINGAIYTSTKKRDDKLV